MKKILKTAFATIGLVLTFFACSAIKVDAALQPSLNNTTVDMNGVSKFAVDGTEYFISKEGVIKLKAKRNNNGSLIIFNTKTYYADVAVVTCNKLSDDICVEWKVYKYSTNGATTMDALDQKRGGLTLNLPDLNYVNTTDTEINGQVLAELSNSIYPVDKTYFAIVKYYQSNWTLGERDTYAPEVFRFTLEADLEKPTITHVVANGATSIIVKSGSPINTLRYFASAEKLESGFDFNAKFTENLGTIALEEASTQPMFNNGKFVHEISITVEDGKHYYFEASDVTGATVIYDLTDDVNQSTQSGQGGDNTSDNVNDTKIGKAVLIALLVLLFASIVLVIVQKIVDHRRKLY